MSPSPLSVEVVRRQAEIVLRVLDAVAPFTPFPQDDAALALLRRLVANDAALRALVITLNWMLRRLDRHGSLGPDELALLEQQMSELPA